MRYVTYGDVIPSSVREYVLGGLKPATQYDVRLAAVNEAGRGPFTDTLPPVTTLQAGTARYCCFSLPVYTRLCVLLRIATLECENVDDMWREHCTQAVVAQGQS